MAPMMRRLDDEDVLDDFDPAFFPKRVYKDGRGPRVRLELTDSAPPYRSRPALYDANADRPHYADLSDARLQDGLRKAAEARDAWIGGLQDAWRGPGNAPRPDGNGNGDDGDDDPEALAARARDEYIARISNAYKTSGPYAWAAPPPALMASMASPRNPNNGGPDDDPKAAATAVEAQRRRWNAESPVKDAALADRDASYNEYIRRLTTAWKRP
jgi:hypothetical protein